MRCQKVRERDYQPRQVYSWALYDWANSAYATTVMAGFFPIFFKQFWGDGIDIHRSTFNLGISNSVASIVIAMTAPILGSIADTWGVRKRFLLIFAAVGIIMTGALGFVARGQWVLAMALYVFATIGFTGGNVFYDSLLVNVSGKKKMDVVSALGYGLGYLGGGILFGFTVVMTLNPDRFGLTSSSEAVRISFIAVAVWWALFSLPLLLFVHEPAGRQEGTRGSVVGAAIRELLSTFRDIRRFRNVFLFLIGYWCYIDGVDTTVLMAVD